MVKLMRGNGQIQSNMAMELFITKKVLKKKSLLAILKRMSQREKEKCITKMVKLERANGNAVNSKNMNIRKSITGTMTVTITITMIEETITITMIEKTVTITIIEKMKLLLKKK